MYTSFEKTTYNITWHVIQESRAMYVKHSIITWSKKERTEKYYSNETDDLPNMNKFTL